MGWRGSGETSLTVTGMAFVVDRMDVGVLDGSEDDGASCSDDEEVKGLGGMEAIGFVSVRLEDEADKGPLGCVSGDMVVLFGSNRAP